MKNDRFSFIKIITDPNRRDTDSDGFPDGVTLYFGDVGFTGEDQNCNGKFEDTLNEYDPNDPTKCPEDPPDFDTDHDGLSDFLEEELGTEMYDADTDDDGLSDGDEYKGEGLLAGIPEYWGKITTDPLNPDTDADGLPDGLEVGVTSVVMGKSFINGEWQSVSHTFTQNYDYYGSLDPAPTEPRTFKFYHPDHLFDSNYLIDGDRSSFTSDASPKSKTSPLMMDTNRDGITDGISDTNANGYADDGETDAAYGFRMKNLESIWEQMDAFVAFPAKDGFGEEQCVEILFNPGDQIGKSISGSTISGFSVSLDPAYSGKAEPNEITQSNLDENNQVKINVTLFSGNGNVLIEPIYSGGKKTGDINAGNNKSKPNKTDSLLNLKSKILNAATREGVEGLINELDKLIDDERKTYEGIQNGSYIMGSYASFNQGGPLLEKMPAMFSQAKYLTDIDKGLIWFLNKSQIQSAYNVFRDYRYKKVNEYFGGNTINDPYKISGKPRGNIFAEFMGVASKEYDEKVERVNTRISGIENMSVVYKEIRGEVINEILNSVYQWQKEYSNISVFEVCENLKKEYVKRVLYLNYIWDIMVSPWAWCIYRILNSSAIDNTKYITALLSYITTVERLPNGFTRLREHQEYIEENPMNYIPQEVWIKPGGPTSQDFEIAYLKWFDLYMRGTTEPIQIFSNAPCGWDIARSHLDMDGEKYNELPKVYDYFYPGSLFHRKSRSDNEPFSEQENGKCGYFIDYHPLVKRTSNWIVDSIWDQVGDDDGRIDHFLTHSFALPTPIEMKIFEDCGFPACRLCYDLLSHNNSEDSYRDKVQNRLGALFGWQIINGKVLKYNVKPWLEVNLLGQ